jgi:hypothetical protein
LNPGGEDADFFVCQTPRAVSLVPLEPSVGGEEIGYFALRDRSATKVVAVQTGILSVPWRHLPQWASRRGLRAFSQELALRFRVSFPSRLFPDNPLPDRW